MLLKRARIAISSLFVCGSVFLGLAWQSGAEFWPTASAVAAVLSLIVIAVNAYEDHKRRRKQITIERLGPLVRKLRRRVQLGDPDPRDILEELEHELVGINEGVYDLDVFIKMFGYTIPLLYEELEEKIKKLRKNDPNSYREFEEVANKFEKELEKCETKKEGQKLNYEERKDNGGIKSMKIRI